MIDLNDDLLQVVKSILKKQVPHCEVRAFGSRVCGNAKPYSDLDLAIVGEQKLHLKEIMGLRQAFEESNLPIRVDVVDWHSIGPEFKSVIEQKYEVV